MKRTAVLAYAFVCYAIFLAAFLYAIGFTAGVAVPKTIDTGDPIEPWKAALVNVLLLSIFAIQHSVMARKEFKSWITRFVPKSIERSTYVLLASLALLLMFWQWRPIAGDVWRFDSGPVSAALTALGYFGWLVVLASTFMISHFELFGVKQAIVADAAAEQPLMKTPMFYKFVRHPIYLGFIIAFWATPAMTLGHLLFAAVTTAYIFVGIALEERDLVGMFGEEYVRYRDRVAMIIPWRFG